MTATQYEILDALVLRPLKDEGAEVFIFGSRVSGKHHSHSDVDILYSLPEGKKISLSLLSELKENIEESSFPFLVDLVDKSDLVESYKQSIQNNIQKL